ncbi:MAG: hypothetical protein FRX48_03530 [Lasallia pustulata]|uniref:Ras-domain-containing protein n=1 Tax=Lasallia pustulata TaxID=136370 RepID=A0A5M8PU21_9LECA|nr:MAG: hypothetical protein FRX48_03530 [Lasallia pustulata]
MTNNLEAKICVLGSQGVGKTSLLNRYVNGSFNPPATTSTIGASFLTKRVLDDSGTVVRLQLWDTAGQERFRSISKLYYRGASACILTYSIIDDKSFEEMGQWLQELKQNVGGDLIIHVVGTKSDVVALDPSLRKVPFERCIEYVAENLYPAQASTPPNTAGGINSKRSSGFWAQEFGWDCCHEVSAKDGEGIEEIFRVITRKLVEQHHKRARGDQALEVGTVPSSDGGQGGYFDGPLDSHGSFRLGSDKRKSWLGFPNPTIGVSGGDEGPARNDADKERRKGRCC